MKQHRLRSALLTGLLLTLGGAAWHYFASPTIGGSTSYVVTHGVSMEPRFHSGDLALVRPAAQYRVGDVVAYHSSLLHIVVLHRIYAIHDGRYAFKGDNNSFLDPVHPTRAQLIGKLWVHWRHGGEFLTALHNPITAAVLIGVIGLLLLSTAPATKRGRRNRRKRRAGGPRPHGAPLVMAENHTPAPAINRTALLGAAAAAGAVAVVFLGVALLAFARPVDRPAVRSIPYTQSVSFGYHASVRPGPVYPSGIVAPGDPIFLQLVHRLGVDVRYRLLNAGSRGLHGTEQVILKLSESSGWSRSIPLTPVRPFNGNQVRAGVVLNLPSLVATLNEISAQTGIPATGSTISVTARVHVRGSLAGGPLATTFAPALSFQLGSLQLVPGGGSATTSTSPQVGLHFRQTGGVAIHATTADDLAVLGVSAPVSTLRVVAPIGFLIALAGALALLLLVARSPAFGESARIQAKYGHMIVPVNSGTDLGWPAIDVASIKALARLAEASGQLILHNHDDTADTYMVNDEGSVYRYQAQLPKVVWGEWSEPPVQLVA
ncbi:MAG: signal peptidase I [Solirubrobacteraceae bacterium]